MNDINELIVTYPFNSEKKNPDADFFALLSFLKTQGIKHCFLTFDLNGNPAEYFEQINKIKGSKKVVYLHIDDITYLYKLKTILSILKDMGCLIIVGGDIGVRCFISRHLSRRRPGQISTWPHLSFKRRMSVEESELIKDSIDTTDDLLWFLDHSEIFRMKIMVEAKRYLYESEENIRKDIQHERKKRKKEEKKTEELGKV